ncbi:MAG: RNA polymerase sigma factor [Candidatus Aminicenantales bacterium]
MRTETQEAPQSPEPGERKPHLRSSAGKPREISLIEGIKRGNREAFNDLFRREQKYLYNLMLRLTGDAAAADDLTQETLLKAYEKISSFRRRAAFRTWITRIAINIFRNEHRKKARHSSLCLGQVLVPGSGASPERLVIKRELQWCILHNLRYHLPRKYREVLVLRDLQHLSYREISRILDCSVSLTKTRLHRARKLFQDQFIAGRCRAYADDYLCICEGILSISDPPGKRGSK